MAYKRYDGLYMGAAQKKVDNGLPKCPFCGDSPHWLLELDQSFTQIGMTCMCEKCGGKLYTQNDGVGYDDNLRVVDVGTENKGNLPLNSVYHIKALNSFANNIGNKEFSTECANAPTISTASNYSNVAKDANKKKILVAIISIAIAIAFFVIILSISSPSGGGYLTYSNYTKIQNGMTYSEVVNILDGHDGTLSTSAGSGGYTLSYYTWSNSSGTKAIVVGFENGKVCAKSQYGLS